ncbi:MAG TPA: hypothetical protein VIT87_04885, partial [Gemmatimonadales bacterium]
EMGGGQQWPDEAPPDPPAPPSVGIEAVRGTQHIMEDHLRERERRGPDAAPTSSYVRVHQDEVTRRRSLPILGQPRP